MNYHNFYTGQLSYKFSFPSELYTRLIPLVYRLPNICMHDMTLIMQKNQANIKSSLGFLSSQSSTLFPSSLGPASRPTSFCMLQIYAWLQCAVCKAISIHQTTTIHSLTLFGLWASLQVLVNVFGYWCKLMLVVLWKTQQS